MEAVVFYGRATPEDPVYDGKELGFEVSFHCPDQVLEVSEQAILTPEAIRSVFLGLPLDLTLSEEPSKELYEGGGLPQGPFLRIRAYMKSLHIEDGLVMKVESCSGFFLRYVTEEWSGDFKYVGDQPIRFYWAKGSSLKLGYCEHTIHIELDR